MIPTLWWEITLCLVSIATKLLINYKPNTTPHNIWVNMGTKHIFVAPAVSVFCVYRVYFITTWHIASKCIMWKLVCRLQMQCVEYCHLAAVLKCKVRSILAAAVKLDITQSLTISKFDLSSKLWGLEYECWDVEF